MKMSCTWRIFPNFLCIGVLLAGVLAVGTERACAAEAATSISAIEKIAVFPVLFRGERGDRVDEATAKALDDTWWQVRDELTATGRFVVASRAFLQKSDAFQPRGSLTVGDAVILGRYVEAHALMTISLRDRALTVTAYLSTDGTKLWSQSVDLHPSVLIREQVAKVSRALVREFIASFPYQGVTLLDALSRQAVFQENGKRLARVRVANIAVTAGDAVEWMELERSGLDPLFQGGGRNLVRAEGVVREVADQTAVVEITRVQDLKSIQIGTLVNLPSEQARLKQVAKPKDSATSAAVVSLLAADASIEPEAKQAERREDESGPLATTLSILGSLAVILLLAF